jgi:hypothetical protein
MEMPKLCDRKKLEIRPSQEVAINCFENLVINSEDQSRVNKSMNFYKSSIERSKVHQNVK